MSDEELLKVVEDIELKMVNEMSDEETYQITTLWILVQFVGPCKRWKKNVVAKQWFTAHFKEKRQPSPDDNVGVSITHALERAIAQQIQNQPDTQPHHTLHFNMRA